MCHVLTSPRLPSSASFTFQLYWGHFSFAAHYCDGCIGRSTNLTVHRPLVRIGASQAKKYNVRIRKHVKIHHYESYVTGKHLVITQ